METSGRQRTFESDPKPSSLKAVFDAYTSDSSLDGCDGDWRAEVMERAQPEDVKRVKDEFLRGGTEPEIARRLDIWPR